jgi:hypothetical protein
MKLRVGGTASRFTRGLAAARATGLGLDRYLDQLSMDPPMG